ncbi:Lrp/AsnC family transcriptional regulator [Streptoalloteichus hindustanus]|uniref:DNA-binding transcriptional regulator, Lrp family n=1 Tax=Streptoalloteichus hindustanus TaxID=2017 RepID=A0A1M5EKE4_STRHI|nr:Lrp/AsnC family transcriptional regulator [Streptoalloteichus hindustanus]SHF79719.1 DNA-binding transcriptional regulator, Lrp family [Streptoalloteichus hindustanus]
MGDDEEVETVTLDAVDRQLAHALAIDGRAPFNRVAAVLGVSENTVARRYRRLRSAGVLRVVGAVDGSLLGQDSWTIRVRCAPEAATAIATALARRPDTFWVHLLSGGTEISCHLQVATPADRDALLLDKLPRTSRVHGISAHAILRGFALPNGWAGLHALDPAQVERLTPPESPPENPPTLTESDHALLATLAKDGRTSHADLATATGWSESTVRRRLDLLRRAGVLSFPLDIAPPALGYHAEARLWMSVRPAALVPVAQTLAQHPEVSFVAATTGPTNLVASIVCRDTRDLYRCLTQRVGTLKAVTTLESAPVMRTVKRAGAVLPL